MLLFFLDDATQDKPTRPKLGKLTAVGGIAVHESKLQSFNSCIEALCREFGFPNDVSGKFKYSPGRELWMRSNLIGDKRTQFFQQVFSQAVAHDVQAFVCCVDSTCNPAISSTNSPEEDVVQLAFERVEHLCSAVNENGLLIFDRPAGDRADGEKFLARCVEMIAEGTEYVKQKHVLAPPLACNSLACRSLQVADLVVSSTTAFVAGENVFSRQIVEAIKPIYYKPQDCIGGWGVKLHPAKKMRNLYHWLFGDVRARNGLSSSQYPLLNHAYSRSPDEY